MFAQMIEPLLGLFDGRNMPGVDPPERHIRAVEFLEPLTPTANQLGVGAAVDVLFKELGRLPDREVEDNSVVLIRPDVCRVTGLGLQPPDKARAAIRKRVDFIQPRDEPLHQRVFKRREHPRDVDLGQVVRRHGLWCFSALRKSNAEGAAEAPQRRRERKAPSGKLSASLRRSPRLCGGGKPHDLQRHCL